MKSPPDGVASTVLTYAFDLWERAFNEVGQADCPDIKRDYSQVDATCMWMVKKPEWFDVIVTKKLKSMQAGKMGHTTSQVGALVPDPTASL